MAKIAVIGKYYAPFSGGIEENTRAIAERLARRHEVTVICNNHERGARRDRIDGVIVERTATAAVLKSQPIGFSTFLKTLRAEGELIHFHAPNPWLSVPLLLKFLLGRRRSRLVITHHMDIYGRPFLRAIARIVYNALLRRADVLIATSEKNVACSSDIRVPCRVAEVPLGIDLARYRLTKVQRGEARAWGRALSGGRPLVGFVGRHARYKGLDVLVRAIAADPELFVVLGGDGPYRAPTERLVGELGIGDRVRFLGQISHDEKLRLLAALDIFAFPSTEITEAFGISQVEAMAAGAPVVASNLPTGVSDVAIDEVTALLAPPGDATALGAAMRRLIDDPRLRERLTANAARAVRERFNNEVVVDMASNVIETALAGGYRGLAAGTVHRPDKARLGGA